MLSTTEFVASLTLTERRATRRPTATEADDLLASWRHGGLENDESFDHYLSLLGLEPDELAGRLHSSAGPGDSTLDWVSELDEANSVAHNDPPALDPVRYGVQLLAAVPFPEFHAPLVAWLDDRLNDLLARPDVTVILTPAGRRGVLTGAVGEVLDVTVRALVEDLAERRAAGVPYDDHRASHSDRGAREATYARFPVMARDVHRVLRQRLQHLRELLVHLSQDLPDLRRAGLASTGPHPTTALADLAAGAGDAHDDGRSVTLLTWTTGTRLVYRPQPGGIVDAARRVADLVAEHTGTPDPVPGSLACGDHTWVEFVAHDADLADLSGPPFYASLGRLAGTSWILGSRDLHMENVVATARGAAPVDLETLLSAPPQRTGPLRALDLCVDAVNGGPTGSGILPVRAALPGRSFEVSVLAGGLVSSTATVQLLADPQGPDVRIEGGVLETGRRQNLPEGASTAGVLAHLDQLGAGFGAAVAALTARPGAVLEALAPAGHAAYPVRTVVRPTSVYSLLLHESRHPRYQRSALAREHLLLRLWGRLDAPFVTPELVASETTQLLNGDIPYFEVRADGRDLTTARGRSAVSRTAVSPVEAVRATLRRATPSHVAQQADLLREIVTTSMSTPGLATTGDGSPLSPPLRTPPAGTREKPLGVAALLDVLVQKFARTALFGERDAAWVGLCSSADSSSFSLQPLGTGLFDGLAGVALALDLAGAALGDVSAHALARRALVPVAEELESWIDQPRGPIGAHSGAGGLAYALATHLTLARAVGRGHEVDPAWADLLPRYVARATAEIPADTYLDVTSGTAGALAVTVALAEAGLVDVPALRHLADAAVDHLDDRSLASPSRGGPVRSWRTGDSGVSLGGFSHGASGIGWALARGAAVLADDRAETLARAALAFEDTYLDARLGLWRDARPEWSTQAAYPVHWCHGATGIALARGQAARWLGDGALALTAGDAMTAVLAHSLPANDSLCHGSLGNAAVLTEVAGPRLAPAAAVYRDEALDRVAQGAFAPGLGLGAVTSPGLMVGFAGLVHHLATELRPGLPNALWLGTLPS